MSEGQLTVKDAIYRLSQFNRRVDEAFLGGFFERAQTSWGVKYVEDITRASQSKPVWYFEFDGADRDAVKAFTQQYLRQN